MTKPFEIDVVPILRRVQLDVIRKGGKVKNYRRIMFRIRLGQLLMRAACWLMFFEYNEHDQ